MLFRANQVPPVLSNNSSMIGQTMPQNTNNSINSMGMTNHFPVSQDVDLRGIGIGMGNHRYSLITLKFRFFYFTMKLIFVNLTFVRSSS